MRLLLRSATLWPHSSLHCVWGILRDACLPPPPICVGGHSCPSQLLPRDSESDFLPSFTCLPWVVLVPSALSGQETRSLSSFPRAQPTLAFRPDLGETKGNDNVDKNASGCCQCDGSWSPEVTARPGRLGQTLSFFGCPQPDIFSCPCWTCLWERPHNLQSSSTPFSGAQLKTKD